MIAGWPEAADGSMSGRATVAPTAGFAAKYRCAVGSVPGVITNGLDCTVSLPVVGAAPVTCAVGALASDAAGARLPVTIGTDPDICGSARRGAGVASHAAGSETLSGDAMGPGVASEGGGATDATAAA